MMILIMLICSAVLVESADAYRAYHINIFCKPWMDPSGRNKPLHPLNALAVRKSVRESLREMHATLTSREAIEGPAQSLKESLSDEDRQSDDIKGEIKSFLLQLSPEQALRRGLGSCSVYRAYK